MHNIIFVIIKHLYSGGLPLQRCYLNLSPVRKDLQHMLHGLSQMTTNDLLARMTGGKLTI